MEEKQKPKYGWYVKNLIIGFNVVGLIGLFALIYGLIITGILQIILIILGVVIVLVFLWPGVGMIALNLFLLQKNQKIDLITKMKALESIDDLHVLDVGCGTGRTSIKIAKTLKNRGHLFGIDIYSKLAIPGNALATVQKNAQLENVEDITTFQYGSAVAIPFEENRFEIVNASSVLHEVHETNGQDKAIKEFYRVLKPDGYLYIGEWNRTSWQCIAFCGLCCFAFKSKHHWEKLLNKYNFKDIRYENIAGFGLYSARK